MIGRSKEGLAGQRINPSRPKRPKRPNSHHHPVTEACRGKCLERLERGKEEEGDEDDYIGE